MPDPAPTELIDFDDVIPYLGEFGRYQWFLFLAMAPYCLNLVLIYFPHIFITLEPDHWCRVPELAGLPLDVRKALSSPKTDSIGGASGGCMVFNVDFNAVRREYELYNRTTPDPLWPTVKCTQWEYDYSNVGGYPSIVSELDWVCDRGNYAATAQSIFFVGAVVGGLLAGWLADKYGRIPVLVATNIIGAVSNILIVSVSSFAEYAIYKFIGGMAFDNIFVMIYVLALEYFAPKHRTVVANMSIAIFYTLGTVVLPWLAIGLGDWRLLSTVCAVPMLLGSMAYFVIPESVRWLMAQGRAKESIEIVKKIAYVNRKIIPEKILERLEYTIEQNAIQEAAADAGSKDVDDSSLLSVFKTPAQCRTFVLVSLFWMLVNLSYDGHIRNVLNLPLDFFIIFTVACATEFPADAMLTATLDRWGRRWYAVGTMVMSGVFTLAVIAIPTENWIAIGVLSILGRFCVNIAFNIGLQWAAEILPTVIRGQGVAAVHIMGYVAALVAPQIVYLGRVSPSIPNMILGILAVVAGFIALFLPETLNADLPNTLMEGEAFCKNFKFLNFPCVKQEEKKAEEVPPLSRDESFIRPRRRTYTRGESYRSSLLPKRRKQNIYLPPANAP